MATQSPVIRALYSDNYNNTVVSTVVPYRRAMVAPKNVHYTARTLLSARLSNTPTSMDRREPALQRRGHVCPLDATMTICIQHTPHIHAVCCRGDSKYSCIVNVAILVVLLLWLLLVYNCPYVLPLAIMTN